MPNWHLMFSPLSQTTNWNAETRVYTQSHTRCWRAVHYPTTISQHIIYHFILNDIEHRRGNDIPIRATSTLKERDSVQIGIELRSAANYQRRSKGADKHACVIWMLIIKTGLSFKAYIYIPHRFFQRVSQAQQGDCTLQWYTVSECELFVILEYRRPQLLSSYVRRDCRRERYALLFSRMIHITVL